MFKHIKNESKKFVVESYKTLNYYHEDLTFVMKYILCKPYKNLTGHDKKKNYGMSFFTLYNESRYNALVLHRSVLSSLIKFLSHM